jgi:hypothetical protein
MPDLLAPIPVEDRGWKIEDSKEPRRNLLYRRSYSLNPPFSILNLLFSILYPLFPILYLLS